MSSVHMPMFKVGDRVNIEITNGVLVFGTITGVVYEKVKCTYYYDVIMAISKYSDMYSEEILYGSKERDRLYFKKLKRRRRRRDNE